MPDTLAAPPVTWSRSLAAAAPLAAAAVVSGQVVGALVAWAAGGTSAPLTVAGVILAQGALAAGLGRSRMRGRALAFAAGAGAATLPLVATGMPALAVLAAVAPGFAAGLVLPRVASRLPAELDGWMRRRPVVAALWAALAIAAAANTARLSIFMVDDTRAWASFYPPMPGASTHQCAAAYVRAAELAARGVENVYDLDHYGDYGDSDAERRRTHVAHLGPWLDDPFAYPPVFLLLPRAGLALSNDFHALRAGWFAVQALGFLAVALMLAGWIGGRAGATAALLVPALLLSLPVAMNLSWGQFQLAAVALSVGGFVAFAARRDWLGGGLLAAAIGSKLFPGALLVHIAAARPRGSRLRPIATTSAWGLLLVAAALAAIGLRSFEAFVVHHLPRIASGEAFSFTRNAIDNHSLHGLVFKLDRLGVPGMGPPVASLASWLYTAAVLVLAVACARRPRDRAGSAMVCLALISLAALRSPYAPTYAVVSTLWLLSVWAGARRSGALRASVIAIAWLLLQGAPPGLPEGARIIASLPGQAVALAAPLLALWPSISRSRAPAPDTRLR